MNYSKFYQLSRDFKRGALQVTSNYVEDEMPIVYGKTVIDKPLIFTHYMGSKVYDIIETGWVSLFLFSEKIFTAFEKNNITGWKKYPTEVYDKKNNLINSYSVFAVTGRCGPLDDSLSEVIWKEPPVPEGNPYQVRKGLYFDLSSWDGSDIFIPDDSLAIIVTEKVRNVLKKIKATNINLRPIGEVESDVF